MTLLNTLLFFTLCSFALAQPKGRVINGDVAQPGQFPFMASLQVLGRHICGAAIIDKQWVVTVAHCVADVMFHQYFEIVTDTTLLNTTGTRYFLSDMINHPNYTTTIYFNDIALLKIDGEIALSETAQPIEIGEALPNQTCVAIGWDNVGVVNELRYADQTALSKDDCDRLAKGGMFDLERIEGQMCALGPEGVAPCAVDSGGPLVCDGKLVAIFSYAITACAEGFPDVYTKVAHYSSWIDDVKGSV